MEKPWSFTENVFDNSTKENNLRMLKIDTYHMNALNSKAGDAFFDALILAYEPLHATYVDVYNKWKNAIGTGKGKTASLDQLLFRLSNVEARKWDIAIQNVYPEVTSRYIELLPNKRAPFQTGSKDERILAVKTLVTAIGADVSLAALKLLVDAFHTLLVDARALQQGEFTNIGDFSEDVEIARIACAVGQYSNLGGLMQHFAATPDAITPFFDLENIRFAEQTLFTDHVNAQTTRNVAKRTIEADTIIRIKNDGPVPLVFCFAEESNDVCTTPSVTVQPGEEETVPASALGNVPASTYINVTNNDSAQQGHFEIEIL